MKFGRCRTPRLQRLPIFRYSKYPQPISVASQSAVRDNITAAITRPRKKARRTSGRASSRWQEPSTTRFLRSRCETIGSDSLREQSIRLEWLGSGSWPKTTDGFHATADVAHSYNELGGSILAADDCNGTEKARTKRPGFFFLRPPLSGRYICGAHFAVCTAAPAAAEISMPSRHAARRT